MALHAQAARHQLGCLIGGEAGAAMVLEAAEAMKDVRRRGVPERYADDARARAKLALEPKGRPGASA